MSKDDVLAFCLIFWIPMVLVSLAIWVSIKRMDARERETKLEKGPCRDRLAQGDSRSSGVDAMVHAPWRKN